MADHYLEITKDIVLAMIEHDKIKSYTDFDDLGKANENYIEEVCKAFKTVYQTVTKP